MGNAHPTRDPSTRVVHFMASKPTILVTRKLPQAIENRLSQDYIARLNEADHSYSPEEIIAHAQGADAVLINMSDHLTAEVIHHLPESVRAIATFSVGYDHIDLVAAKQRHIAVINTPGVLTEATADLTLMLLLCASAASQWSQCARAIGELER